MTATLSRRAFVPALAGTGGWRGDTLLARIRWSRPNRLACER